jgi:gamma-glutamylcysteine synthetase
MQVNLDFSSEQDMISKFRASLALQPVGICIVLMAIYFGALLSQEPDSFV